MKVKTIISAALLFILTSQPAFSWFRVPQERIWRGGWTVIRIPVTPTYVPILFPIHQSKIEQRGQIRTNRNFIQERKSNYNRFKSFGKKTVQVRRPKR